MNRLSTLVALGALLLLAGIPSRVAREATRAVAGEPSAAGASALPQPLDGRSCKPLAPIETTLHVRRGTAPGRVAVQLDVTARIALAELGWQLELPTGVTLVAGAPSGALDGRPGFPQSVQLELSWPPAARGAVGLVLDGLLDGTSEHVGLRREIGQPVASPTPIRELIDSDTGGRVRVAVLPVSHRPGR